MKSELIDKAMNSLKAAELLFDNGLYDDCASRSYYAAFQAAIVALANNNFYSDNNNHDWVQATFVMELINRKKVYNSSFKSFLSTLLEVRIKADYKEAFVTKKVAKRQLDKAIEFVGAIKKEMKHVEF